MKHGEMNYDDIQEYNFFELLEIAQEKKFLENWKEDSILQIKNNPDLEESFIYSGFEGLVIEARKRRIADNKGEEKCGELIPQSGIILIPDL